MFKKIRHYGENYGLLFLRKERGAYKAPLSMVLAESGAL